MATNQTANKASKTVKTPAHVNSVTLTGYVVDSKFVEFDGGTVVRTRLLTVEKYDGGESKTYHTVVRWNAESADKVGDTVSVNGKLKSRSYEKNGVRVWVTEIVANETE